MSIFYGIVPYIGVLYLASFLATGNISYLTRLFVWGMIATLNEVIFKRIFDQRRPSGSCLYFESYGMPSGHAATSMGLLTYILLELFVYHPNVLCGLTCQSRRRRRTRDEEAGTTTTTASSSSRIDYSFVWGYGWYVPSSGRGDANDPAGGGNGDGDNDDGADDIARSDSVFVHIRDVDANIAEGVDGGGGTIQGRGKWVHHIYALCYALLLLPVPFSRVYLHDHTRDQVLAGSALGVSISIIWYICFVRTFGGKLLTRWGKSDCGRWWGLKLGTV
ncbi:hypothetical protein ACHAXA_005202 [Cyclostephanos tholiformis]|uniref:Phosphatidic acid phosphatase type 2/haloperoxidase domain-containing protein n=1 Tax=Cyclostephanos tholiformis TaxID=382380 RepID=A0ABD3SEN1_9STRA